MGGENQDEQQAEKANENKGGHPLNPSVPLSPSYREVKRVKTYRSTKRESVFPRVH
jgi:hypothetical protein